MSKLNRFLLLAGLSTSLVLGAVACGSGSSSSPKASGSSASAVTTSLTAPTSSSALGVVSTASLGTVSTASVAPTATSMSPRAAQVSQVTTLTVTGERLLAVQSAALVPDAGGPPTPLAWTATNDQSAQAIAPAGLTPGDYRLELSHAGGVARTPATFEALALTPPTLGSITPASGTNDRPHTVTLRGTSFVSSSAVTVGSLSATSVTLVSATELQAVFPERIPPGPHTVTVRHAAGTSSAAIQWTAQNLIDPDQAGAFLVGYADDVIAGASGDSPRVRYYYPAVQSGLRATADPSGGPYPVVIFNHGFRPPLLSFGISFQNNTFAAEWLASFGYVVACVDLATNNNLFGTGQANCERDADDTLAAIDYLEAANTDPAHPLQGVVDATRVGLAGHSRGGDAALMAASEELAARGQGARVKAIAAFGPPAIDSRNSNAPLAFGAFSQLPLLLIGGNRDEIAPPRDQQAILAQAGTPSMSIEIEGGSHSQYKDNSTRIWGDGTATISLADQHSVVRRYLTAWFGAHVKGQQALFADYVMQGAQVTADTRLRAIDVR